MALLLAIVINGNILDTFGELRQLRDKIDTDQKQKCFICGFAWSDFGQSPGQFEHHTKFEHNMWDFLFAMYYVRRKPTKELNGLEAYVLECMNGKKPDFSPLQRVLVTDVKAEGQRLLGFLLGAR